MKKATKIGIILGSSAVVILLGYFLIPLKAWKEYKENHPSLFAGNDDNTPKYSDFVNSYWKTTGKVMTGNIDDITYDGGELPEIVITPQKEEDNG